MDVISNPIHLHHVDFFRALESPKFILIDEGDFFPIGQRTRY